MVVKKLFEKYKSLILYIFFGVCTTAVNIVVFWLMAHPLNFGTVFSSVVAWTASVIFAYITNRRWVFESKARGAGKIFREVYSFFACRFATGVLDCFLMFIFVDIFGLDDVIIKILLNIIVIVLNYIGSKIFFFFYVRN